MADIAKELIVYLKTKPAIRNKVGSGVASRIYTELAKQSVKLPFIVFEVFEGTSEECLDSIAGVASNRIQLVCYGATSDDAWSLAEAVRLAPLQMYRGEMGAAWVDAVSADDGYLRGYDQAPIGGNQRRYWISRDYDITYQEPTAA